MNQSGSKKKEDKKEDMLSDVRQKNHLSARKSNVKQGTKQPISALADLVKRVETSNAITLQPQHLPFVQHTTILLSPEIADYSALCKINPKQDIVSITSIQNKYVTELNINFSRFPNLDYITFDKGQLTHIDNVTIEKTKLNQISFEGNQIQVIKKLPRFPFRLRHLRLSNNNISSLDFLKQSNLRNLTHLYLDHSHISSIASLVDVDFRYLLELHLSHNLISNIDCIGQINFKNLKKLDLESNKIVSISQIHKVNISNFNWIELSHNQITDFTPLLRIESKNPPTYVYNVYVEEYFPGIYIRENEAKAEQLEELLKNSKNIKYVGEVEEEEWDTLFEKFGRYDNYGQDETERQKQIKQNEVNSLEGDDQKEELSQGNQEKGEKDMNEQI